VARAIRLELQNTKTKAGLCVRADVERDQQRFHQMMSAALLTAPGRIKQSYPDMPEKYVNAIREEIAHIVQANPVDAELTS